MKITFFIKGEGNQSGRKGNKGSPGHPVRFITILNSNIALDIPSNLLSKVKGSVKYKT